MRRPWRGAAVVAALWAAFLAWAGHSMLGPALGPPRDPVPTSWRVTASGAPVLLRSVLVDGRDVHLDRHPAVRLREGWSTRGARGDWSYRHEGEGRSVLELRAGRLALSLEGDEGARVVVARDGTTLRAVTVSGEVPLWVEAPARAVPWWSLPLWVALAGGLLLVTRPWSHERSGAGYVLGHHAVLYGVYWLTQPVGGTTDVLGYLAAFERFTDQGEVSFFPMGYGMLMWAAGVVPFPGAGLRVTLLQAAAFVVAAVWTYRLLAIGLPRWASLLGAVAAFSTVTSLEMAHGMLSEAPTVVGLVGAAYFAVRAQSSGRYRDAVIAGVLGGVAGLMRIVPIAAAGAAWLVVFGARPSRRAAALGGAALATMAVVMALPLAWVAAHGNRPGWSNSSGQHLLNAVLARDMELPPERPHSARLTSLLTRDELFADGSTRQAALARHGLNYPEQMELQRRAALEAIRAAPWEYVWGKAKQAVKQLWEVPGRQWTHGLSDPVPDLTRPAWLGASARALSWRQRLERLEAALWHPLVVAFAVSMLLIVVRRRGAELFALGVLVPGLLYPTALGEARHVRYTMPVVPFVVAVGLAAPALAASLLRRRRREATSTPPATAAPGSP